MTNSLEQILEAYGKYDHISHVEDGLKKDGDAPENYLSFAAYKMNYDGISQNDATTMVNAPEFTSKTARRYASMLKSRDSKNLVELVKANYDALVNEIEVNELENYAVQLSKEFKESQMLDKAFKDKNYGLVKSVIAAKYDDPMWKEVVKYAGEASLAQLLQNYNVERQNKFVIKTLRDEKIEKGKDGKDVKTYEPNADKIKAYISKTLKDSKGAEDYVQLAGLYNKLQDSK